MVTAPYNGPGKVSHPISLKETELSTNANRLYPAILLGSFLVQFRSIVQEPVIALTSALLPLAAAQTFYMTTCLPSANSNFAAQVKGVQRKRPNQRAEESLRDLIGPAVLSLIVGLFFGAPVIAIGLVLMGAPVTTHQIHTVLCGAHMALLAAPPLVYVHGLSKEKWIEIGSLWSPFDAVFGGAVGTLFGAWLGAIPIPLDWDREWQKWPITVVTGAYLGCIAGKWAGAYIFRGKRLELQ